jgi:xanthine/CO dehydrogenase XdhC/CoxF family maturation factor
MMAELKQEGLEVSGPRLDRIFTPAGLDMGAETPEEIALSIISEIKSVLSGRKGGSLRLSKEPIHPRSDSVILEKILF